MSHTAEPDPSADIILDESELEARAATFDRANMAKVIEGLPAQIEIALKQDIPARPEGPFRRVVIAGMGGSALPMDVLLDVFAEQLKVPVIVWRRYNLPSSLIDGSLVIVSSFSGNTEEAISVIKPLPKGAQNTVVVCREDRVGEKPVELARLGAERDYPIIRIPVNREPGGFQPRSAVGYTVTFLARVLSRAGVLDGAQAELEAVPPFLRRVETRQPAEKMAIWLAKRIPVVYTDETHLMSIARVAKIKFNENSKRPALFNALSEANHNEMIGFLNRDLARFGVLYLHDSDSDPRIRHRFNVMKNVFEKEGLNHVCFRQWEIPGTTNVQKIFAALAFVDWCSYTLALLDGLDPTPVDLVETFKGELEMSSSE